MNTKVLDAVERYRMFSQGDRLAVGISGGADSVALTHFLRSIAMRWGLELCALHLNHLLRGEESDRDEGFVRRLCADWGIPLTVESAPVALLARERGMTVEQCAREVRYEFFRRHLPQGGKVCTAHTVSDNAETVLINLTRGTGLRGLCGIPPVRDNIIRPLILCTRQDVEEYCALHDLTYVIDSTNTDLAYTRNRLRSQVVPVLRKLNPGWLGSIAGNADILRADADYLDAQAAGALEAACLKGNQEAYDRERLRCLPVPLAMRALAAILHKRGIAVNRRRLEQVRSILEVGGSVQVSGRWILHCETGQLIFRPAHEPTSLHFAPVVLEHPFSSRSIPIFSGKVLQVIQQDYAIFKESINNSKKVLKNALDCDRIEGIATFRSREPGDIIRLAGRGCTKSLKKLYNEAHLSGRERQQTLVLSGENGLLWVEGFGVAETACVRNDTRRVLLVEVLEDVECTKM